MRLTSRTLLLTVMMCMAVVVSWQAIGQTRTPGGGYDNNLPDLPPRPTVYERNIDMSYIQELTVPLKSNDYRRSELFTVVRCPNWLEVSPWDGIVGIYGMEVVLRVDERFLSPGTNIGQIIVETSQGYTILNVQKQGYYSGSSHDDPIIIDGGGRNDAAGVIWGVIIVLVILGMLAGY